MVDLAAAAGGGAAELARRLRAAGFQASEVRPRSPGGRFRARERRSCSRDTCSLAAWEEAVWSRMCLMSIHGSLKSEVELAR